MEKQIDVLSFLGGVVAKNTTSYRSDFQFDKDRLTAATSEAAIEDRTFLWMSRPCGTWCLRERDVFLRGSEAHTIWTNKDYEDEAAQIKAYRVVVAPEKQGVGVLGEVYPLNYKEQIQRVKENAVPVHDVTLTFEDGEERTLTYEEFTLTSPSLIRSHGKIEAVRYKPESEAELSSVIEREHRQQKGRKPRRKKSTPQHGER